MKTAEELWNVSHKGRHELVRGEIIEMTPAGGEHGLLTMELSRRLSNHVIENDLGIVLAAETGIKLPNGDVRAADITFINKEHRPARISRKYENTIPDLVVEVISPADTHVYVAEKVSEWQKAGVKEVWVADPGNRVIFIYETSQDVVTVEEEDEIRSTRLPGFTCKAGEVFAILD